MQALTGDVPVDDRDGCSSGRPNPVGNRRAVCSSDDGWRWPVTVTVREWFSGRLGSTRRMAATRHKTLAFNLTQFRFNNPYYGSYSVESRWVVSNPKLLLISKF